LALYTKIGLYALLTVSALALVKEARRRVAEFDDARFRSERAEAAEASAVAASVAPDPSRMAIPFTPRRTATALATRPSATRPFAAAIPTAPVDLVIATLSIEAPRATWFCGAAIFGGLTLAPARATP